MLDQQRINTDGGAFISGGIDTQGGTFVGRDQYQYVGYTYEQVITLIETTRERDQLPTWNGHQPYLGLNAFQEGDAELFFGREKLVTVLVNRVKQAHCICVTGPSGSGKSSLVRAGLIHALRTYL